MGAKITAFVTNTVFDFKLLKTIYHNYMSEELWGLWVKDALKVQLLQPIPNKAFAINILQDITNISNYWWCIDRFGNIYGNLKKHSCNANVKTVFPAEVP